MRPTRHLKHPNKLTTESGFRLVRAFTVDHNIRRLRCHLDALSRRPDAQRFHRRWRLRLRLRELARTRGAV